MCLSAEGGREEIEREGHTHTDKGRQREGERAERGNIGAPCKTEWERGTKTERVRARSQPQLEKQRCAPMKPSHFRASDFVPQGAESAKS